MFKEFPDIINISQLQIMLGIGKSTAYSLLRNNKIRHVKVGRKYIIPKKEVIEFLNEMCYNMKESIVG